MAVPWRSWQEYTIIVGGFNFTIGYSACQFMHGDRSLILVDLFAGSALTILQIIFVRWAKSAEPRDPSKGE